MRKEAEQLWQLVEPHVMGAGLELVELDFNREAEGWVLRVYIDRPWNNNDQGGENSRGISNASGGGELRSPEPTAGGFGNPSGVPISFNECERVSRDLSAALDVADAITHAYRLEVSSPGLERPLRRARDFQRFAGEKVKVRTVDMVEGRRNFSGTIRGANGDVVEVECDGRCYQIPASLIARAHLVPDWEAEFRRGGNRPLRSAS